MPNFDDVERLDLTPAQIEQLTTTVQQGALIRDWCKHPAYKIFQTWIEGKIADKKQEWLRADDHEATKIRAKATAWIEIQDEFKKFMLSGDNAARLLAKYSEQKAQENLEAPTDSGQG